MTQTVRVVCPKCSSIVRAPTTVVGQRVRCGECNERFTASAASPLDETPTARLHPNPAGSDLSTESPAGPPRNRSKRIKPVSYDLFATSREDGQRPWQLRYTIFFLCSVIPPLCALASLILTVSAIFLIVFAFDSPGDTSAVGESALGLFLSVFSASVVGAFSYGLGSLVDHVAEICEHVRSDHGEGRASMP